MYDIQVVLGVARNFRGELLIAYRHPQQEQGGCWEFPGGKVEPGESCKAALRREYFEETGLCVQSVRTLIQFKYDYADKCILFHVFLIESFSGNIDPKKCASCKWVPLDSLADVDMPAANQVIFNALTLPPYYMITPNLADAEKLINIIKAGLDRGIRLIQLRTHLLAKNTYCELANVCFELCSANQAKLIVNCESDWLIDLSAHGYHLSGFRLESFIKTKLQLPISLFSVSCHNQNEIEQSNPLQPVCLLIAPVLQTDTHPDCIPLDWHGFHQLSSCADVPVYGLGGMRENDLEVARSHGGQGVSGISMFL